MTRKNIAIKCRHCGQRRRVDFAYCLSNGWPKCCGETMFMVGTTANIDKAVGQALKPVGTFLNAFKGGAA